MFDRARSVTTEVTSRVTDLADAMHVGGDRGVVSASEAGEVDSVCAWQVLFVCSISVRCLGL